MAKRIKNYDSQGKRDKDYRKFQKKHRLHRGNAQSRELRIQKPCETYIGGKQMWMRGERKDGSKYMYPFYVDGAKCNNPAVTSRTVHGKVHHWCRSHPNVEWLKEDGEIVYFQQ